MGETFGHVVPGVFYCVIALILLFITRQNRDDPKNALTGSKGMRAGFGWGCALTAGTGCVIEAIGGLLHNGDLFFQFAHETMYGAFFVVGVMALAESRGRMPDDTWRFCIAVAFFLEGLVFYGHSLEQEGIEQMLHFVMVLFSWFTALSYVLACVFKRSFLPHVLGASGMLAKGIWFFVIAHILYSGKLGDEGKELMLATGYTLAGASIIVLFSLIGCCIFAKPNGAYDEVEDDEASTGLQAESKKKYNKVDLSTDA
jgi:hypothetical protein